MLVEAHGSSANPSDPREASEVWLEGLRQSSTDDARVALLKFMGVGRKVADCVLLMSMNKREVIPVDTHVHQIAIKHYGMKGSLKGKAAMTPKLYNEVNSKLATVWGDYAGWAHSVLFTADLKSFASFGLDVPTSEPALSSTRKQRLVKSSPSLLPSPPPTPLPLKRKNSIVDDVVGPLEELDTLAERVKRRRR